MKRISWVLAGVVILTVAVLLVAPNGPAAAQLPAGTTNAVLSYVDAADGHVSVVRHWHGSGGEDVQVTPFTPYWWDGCLPFQNGALMFLITSPVGYPPPQLTSSEAYASQYLAKLGQLTSAAIAQAGQSVSSRDAQANLARIQAAMVTPGSPEYEALKAAPMINSLSAYEDYGYAVFMFVRWKWIYIPFPVPAPCAQIDIIGVSEGYGIPIVTQRGACRIRFYLAKSEDTCPRLGHFPRVVGQL